MLAETGPLWGHEAGDQRLADETYMTVAGVWRHAHRVVDQHGQVIDVVDSKTPAIALATKIFKPHDPPPWPRGRRQPISPRLPTSASSVATAG